MTSKYIWVLIFFLFPFLAYSQTAQEYYNMGSEKTAARNYQGAIKDFDQAIGLDAKFTDAWFNRGTSKLYLRDYKEAIADFDKALELRPGFIKALTNRAIAELKTFDTKAAISDFDAILKIDTQNTSAWFLRGQTELQLGDTKTGCSDLTKAYDLGDTRAKKFLAQNCGRKDLAEVENKSNEYLKLDWPDNEGWKIASNQEDKERKMIELLRNNETFENWTEIGTMMVYPSLRNVPVDAAMNVMFEQAKKNFPNAKLTFIEKDEKARYPWIIYKIECPDINGPESQVWQIMQGSNELYVNFRAVKQITVPEDLKNKWVAFFKTAGVEVK